MNSGDFSRDIKHESVTRSGGITNEERYLQKLCDHSFLTLWSYAGVFRDQKGHGKGDGKELCDLLVVCGDDILIFSDKGCAFPNTGDVKLDWTRWFRRSVQKSAEQAWAAGRWLINFPDRIFLDRACVQNFPLELPPSDRMRIHYIIVAHNISKRCSAHFPGSSGSLAFDSSIVGDAHFSGEHVLPFFTGWIDSGRPFVHVLDDETLDILLSARDTITDFVEYLRWKEALLQSAVARGITVMYGGEEDLLANYLLALKDNQQGFGLPPEPARGLTIDEGSWRAFLKSPQRAAQVEADEDSYFWDYIIEEFCRNILAGTSYDRAKASIADRERAVRALALERRLHRRILARALIEHLGKTPSDFRAVRVTVPGGHAGPYYCFLLHPILGRPIDEYRRSRAQHLAALVRVTKLIYPDALDIVGLAMESGSDMSYRSEDLIYLDARNWSEEEQEQARHLQKTFDLLTRPRMSFVRDFAFPVDAPPQAEHIREFAAGKNPRNKPCGCGSGKKFKHCHGA